MCQRKRIQTATPRCQSIPGASIDDAIGTLLVETVTPAALEVALQVQQELRRRVEEAGPHAVASRSSGPAMKPNSRDDGTCRSIRKTV